MQEGYTFLVNGKDSAKSEMAPNQSIRVALQVSKETLS